MSPAPSAMMEGFGEFGLLFALYAFVPEPGLVGPVRHRLCSEIQRRFAEEGIVIPLPTRELNVSGLTTTASRTRLELQPVRRDAAAIVPPEPHARPGRAGVRGRADLTIGETDRGALDAPRAMAHVAVRPSPKSGTGIRIVPIAPVAVRRNPRWARRMQLRVGRGRAVRSRLFADRLILATAIIRS